MSEKDFVEMAKPGGDVVLIRKEDVESVKAKGFVLAAEKKAPSMDANWKSPGSEE